MVMGSSIQGLPGHRFGDPFPNPAGFNSYRFDGFPRGVNGDLSCVLSSGFSHTTPPLESTAEYDDSHQHPEICSDIALGYINKILMEEDIDQKVHDSALLAAEKPFLEILTDGYSQASPNGPPMFSDSPEDNRSGSNHVDWCCGHGIGDVFDDRWASGSVCELHSSPELRRLCLHYAPQSELSSCGGGHCNGESFQDLLVESDKHMLECQFRRGVEEARKFLPDASKFVIDLEATTEEDAGKCQQVKSEEDRSCSSGDGSRGQKNPHVEESELELEERKVKQLAVVYEETIRSRMFDEVLLCNCGKKTDAVTRLREALQNQLSKNMKNTKNNTKKCSGGKNRGKRQVIVKKDQVIDLRTILIHCAQSVAIDDRRSANELLRQIRQHSSATGDASQRLAEIFANGLEARMAGTGSERYHSFVAKRKSASNVLKAYHLFIAACPFRRISHYFANLSILNVAEDASKLHIVDFGINFGFQWPCLIQRLSMRPNGPPKLRITGIDIPEPGFHPTERLEETGRRLADYCQSFGVPFEYHHIATNWDTINVKDLNISEDEVLVVNCMYRLRHLAEETVSVDSPRSIVLRTIRNMNPDLFIHAVVNGSYNAPFFVTRFREALFHYSSLFDMLDATVPREQPERLLIETEIFGREAMNVIACEGSERIERPETYKQWQVRNLRAGFKQLPLNSEITKKCKDRVRSGYHKDFLIDEDSRWLLQGWKGRITFAISTWKPDDKD